MLNADNIHTKKKLLRFQTLTHISPTNRPTFAAALCSTGRIHEGCDLSGAKEHWRNQAWVAWAALRLSKLLHGVFLRLQVCIGVSGLWTEMDCSCWCCCCCFCSRCCFCYECAAVVAIANCCQLVLTSWLTTLSSFLLKIFSWIFSQHLLTEFFTSWFFFCWLCDSDWTCEARSKNTGPNAWLGPPFIRFLYCQDFVYWSFEKTHRNRHWSSTGDDHRHFKTGEVRSWTIRLLIKGTCELNLTTDLFHMSVPAHLGTRYLIAHRPES